MFLLARSYLPLEICLSLLEGHRIQEQIFSYISCNSCSFEGRDMEASVLPSGMKHVLSTSCYLFDLWFNRLHSGTLFQTKCSCSFRKTLHTSESSRKIRNVRFKSRGHLIKSSKLKKRPPPSKLAPVICVRKKWYVSKQ